MTSTFEHKKADMKIYETQRLVIREMTIDDLPALAAMLQDPACMSAYEGAFSESETQTWMNRQLERYREDGFGTFWTPGPKALT